MYRLRAPEPGLLRKKRPGRLREKSPESLFQSRPEFQALREPEDPKSVSSLSTARLELLWWYWQQEPEDRRSYRPEAH